MDPNQAQAKLLHAIALTNLSLYPRARAELEEFLKLFPGSTDAKVQLGAVAIGQKQYREAQSIFQKMDETVSGDPRGVIGLTATFAAQNQLDKALQLLQAEKKRSPQSSVIANLLARTAIQAGNFDLAIETYRELLESNQRSADLNLSLGRALMAKRDFANAIPALERAQALAPKDSRADLLLVSALKQSGRTGEVKAHLQRALSADPNNPIVLNSMAFYLADAGGDLDEALQLSQRVVTKYKDQPNFADTLGWIYLKKDLRDPALKIFSNLVKKQPDNPTFHYHLGAALAANGEKQKAREELEAALRSSPPKDQEQKIREILAKLG